MQMGRRIWRKKKKPLRRSIYRLKPKEMMGGEGRGGLLYSGGRWGDGGDSPRCRDGALYVPGGGSGQEDTDGRTEGAKGRVRENELIHEILMESGSCVPGKKKAPWQAMSRACSRDLGANSPDAKRGAKEGGGCAVTV